MKNFNVNWATIIPLIGGSSIGSFKTTQTPPKLLLSYSAFSKNDESLIKYWSTVPYINLDKDKADIKRKSLDFVSAVCPCGGLSQLNGSVSKTKKGGNAIQNEWMYKTANLILSEVEPKCFWGENAPALFTDSGKIVSDNLYEIAKKHSYSFSLYKTNSIYHGLPQKRERTFYFFWNSKYAPIFDFYRKTSLDLAAYLKEIPLTAKYHNDFFVNEKLLDSPFYIFAKNKYSTDLKKIYNDKKCCDLCDLIIRDGLLKEFQSFLQNHYDNKDKNRWIHRMNHVEMKINMNKRYWCSSPSLLNNHTSSVIGKNIYMVHPEEERYLSVREYMHLMGMPHDFEFADKPNMQILSQNVPSNTAGDMTEQVVKFINNELSFGGSNYIKQNNINKSIIAQAISKKPKHSF